MDPIFLIPREYEAIASKYNTRELILLHIAMANDKYVRHFRDCKNYKILDNSAYELREALRDEDIMKFAKKMKVQEVVAPDVMFKSNQTIQRTKQFLEANDTKKYKVMGVVHGQTKGSWLKCFKWMNTNDMIDVIGISKADIWWNGDKVSKDKVMNRYRQIWELSTIIKKPVHLFGATDIRDFFLDWPSYVRSMDSKCLLKVITHRRGWNATLDDDELERYVDLMGVIRKYREDCNG